MTGKLATLSARRLALALGIMALIFSSAPSAPKRLHQSSGLIRAQMQSLLSLYGADAVTLDRNARDYKSLEEIKWQGRPGSVNQTATVFGDPTKAGMYVTLLKRGPDDWSEPHTHPNDRYITVLSGTMLIGTGSNFDKKNVVAMGPAA